MRRANIVNDGKYSSFLDNMTEGNKYMKLLENSSIFYECKLVNGSEECSELIQSLNNHCQLKQASASTADSLRNKLAKK